MINSLHDTNFHNWLSEQTELLRSKEFDRLDMENIIEELESLGASEERALESYFIVLLMHKLKVEYQKEKHSRSWDLSIKNSTLKINRLIRKNPGLKSKLNDIFNDAYESARLEAAIETGLDEDIFPETCLWQYENFLN